MEKFTKVKNIGKGNMGACALARNNEDGRYYVIKQVDLAKLNKKERQQSLNEAKVLSSLRHPNVINYVDSFLARKSDHLCIVMEYADGGDLSQKVKHSHGVNFSQDQVLDWFIQLTLALHYIHGKKILHRDVKTQNVFLTQDGLCKLGDFGIARTLSNTFDQANTFVGTPYYLSPELILERPYDCMSDVWALGVVLYESMALKHPFNANDMKSLMHRILKVQYEAPPHIYGNDVRSIVGRLLVKDASQRMKLSEVLELPIIIHRMQQWLDGGIVPSRYLASLLRHKLVPAQVLATLPQQDNQLPILPAATSSTRREQEPAAVNEERMSRYMQEEYAQKQMRREEIRNEFREVREQKLKPKPSNAQMMYQYAQENGAPMPQRNPSLLDHEPMVVRAAGPPTHHPLQRNLQPIHQGVQGQQAIHGQRSSIVDALNDEAGKAAQMRASPTGFHPAVPPRLQPSVRHIPSFHGGYQKQPQQPQGPNANIQAMLEKAAQQRMLARQPAPLQQRY